MRRRWSLVSGLVAAAVLLPLFLLSVPGDGPSRRVQIAAWAVTLAVVVLVGWSPMRRWLALPLDERRASLRGLGIALPASMALAVALAGIAAAIAVLTLVGDAPLAARVALASPLASGSWSYTLVLAAPLLWAFRRPTPTAVSGWCRRRGVTPTATVVTLVRADLFSLRVFRTIGAVTGVAVGYGPAMANNRLFTMSERPDAANDALMSAWGASPTVFDPLTLAMVGYVVGALVAERRRRSARPAAQPAAALDARRVESYTAPLARWLPPGAAALLVVVAGVRAVIGDGADPTATSPTMVGQAALAAVVLAVVAALVRRWIVSRPQRTADATALVVDDAFRAAAVHATAGAISAVTVAYALLGLQALSQAAGVSQAVGGVLGAVLGIGGILLVIGLWLGFGSSFAWRVTRADDREEVTA